MVSSTGIGQQMTPTQESPSTILGIVVSSGILLFGYGVLAVIHLLPWPPLLFGGLVVVSVCAIGALDLSLGLVVVIWLRFRDNHRPFSTFWATSLAGIAVILALGLTGAVTELSPGESEWQFWLIGGLLILAIQFVIGARVSRWGSLSWVFLGELLLVFSFSMTILITTRADMQTVYFLALSAASSVLLCLFGWPLYMLGSRMHPARTEPESAL